ncbi:MAG TPA: ComEC/Rec2 family competence protein [Chthoniobacterales bacterium]
MRRVRFVTGEIVGNLAKAVPPIGKWVDGKKKWGRQPFCGLAAAGVAGISIAEWVKPGLAVTLPGLGLSLVLWMVLRRTWALLTLMAAAFILLHSLQFHGNPGRLLAAELGDRRVVVRGEGTVNSQPMQRVEHKGRIETSFEIDVDRIDFPGFDQAKGLRLLVSWPGPGPEYGAKIGFAGSLFNPKPPRNPGEFDYAGWLGRRQVFSVVNVRMPFDATVVDPAPGWSVTRMAMRCRRWMETRLAMDLESEPEIAGIIKAMVLGSTNETSDELKARFQQTGTLHLFAVSGLQVTVLAGMVMFALETCRVPRRVAVFVTIPVILFYAAITGLGASSVRAALMASIFLAAILADRPAFTLNNLAASAFLLLLTNTNQLFATGFQLSYSVVAAIILLAGRISRFVQGLVAPDPFIPRKLLTKTRRALWWLTEKLGGSVGLTVAAWMGSLPLTAWYFNLLSPVALVANLVVVPLSSGILLLGVLSIVTSAAGSFLSVLFNNANWLVVKIMLELVGFFASLPAGYLHIGGRWIEFTNEHRITVLDLGAGGSVVIETPRGCWLIDTGSDADYSRIVQRFLQKRGINSLKGIVLTHGDGAHVGGIVRARNDFPQVPVFVPVVSEKSTVFKRLRLLGETNGLKTGDMLTLSNDAVLEVLFPSETTGQSRADDNALVLAFRTGKHSVLLMSDSGFSTEISLLENAGLIEKAKADVIVMGRNRTDRDVALDFFLKTGPKAIVSSCVSFPAIERVPLKLVKFSAETDVRLFRQDETGALEMRLSEQSLDLRGFLNREALNIGH